MVDIEFDKAFGGFEKFACSCHMSDIFKNCHLLMKLFLFSFLFLNVFIMSYAVISRICQNVTD